MEHTDGGEPLVADVFAPVGGVLPMKRRMLVRGPSSTTDTSLRVSEVVEMYLSRMQ
jgi:hypothetical protein